MNLLQHILSPSELSENDVLFQTLLSSHIEPLYFFLFQIVRNRELAEDAVQETCIKAWKHFARFDRSRNFKTWIFTIGKNTALDMLRKKQETPFAFFRTSEEKEVFEEVVDTQPLPDEILSRIEDRDQADALLGQLSSDDRMLLALVYREGFSLDEVSLILEKPYNTVKSRHSRALSRLRSLLTPPLDASKVGRSS